MIDMGDLFGYIFIFNSLGLGGWWERCEILKKIKIVYVVYYYDKNYWGIFLLSGLYYWVVC